MSNETKKHQATIQEQRTIKMNKQIENSKKIKAFFLLIKNN